MKIGRKGSNLNKPTRVQKEIRPGSRAEGRGESPQQGPLRWFGLDGEFYRDRATAVRRGGGDGRGTDRGRGPTLPSPVPRR